MAFFRAIIGWVSMIFIIFLVDTFAFYGVSILASNLSAEHTALSISIVVVIGLLISFLGGLNFYAVNGVFKFVRDGQRRRENLQAIDSMIEKRKESRISSSSLDFVYIELMEHYLRAEINQDMADIREASERKRKFLKRFYD